MIDHILTAAQLVAVIRVAAASVVQCLTDPRFSRAYIHKSLFALAAYAVHTAIGIILLIFVVPQDIAPWGLGVALVGWLGLGALGLIRLAPRTEEGAGVLTRFGIVDLACLVLVGGGLAVATVLVPPILSSCITCSERYQELKIESGTRNIDLLVPLLSEVRVGAC